MMTIISPWQCVSKLSLLVRNPTAVTFWLSLGFLGKQTPIPAMIELCNETLNNSVKEEVGLLSRCHVCMQHCGVIGRK